MARPGQLTFAVVVDSPVSYETRDLFARDTTTAVLDVCK